MTPWPEFWQGFLQAGIYCLLVAGFVLAFFVLFVYFIDVIERRS